MPKKNRGRERSAALTEARLLEAAEAVFSKKGYADATIADIVERAQVSRGTFYLYFKDKDEAFTKLVSRVLVDLFALSSASYEPGTLRQRVEASTRRYLQIFQKHRLVLRSLFAVTSFKPEFAKLHNELRSQFIQRIQRHLERNIARDHVAPIDTHVASYALSLMLEAFAYSWLVAGFEPWPKPLDFETVVRELTNLSCRAAYRDGVGDAPAITSRARPVGRAP